MTRFEKVDYNEECDCNNCDCNNLDECEENRCKCCYDNCYEGPEEIDIKTSGGLVQ